MPEKGDRALSPDMLYAIAGGAELALLASPATNGRADRDDYAAR